MSKVVYLLRHGEAKHNLYDTGPGSYERRRDPALVDPPLTEKGKSQVQAARQEMEADSWQTRIYMDLWRFMVHQFSFFFKIVQTGSVSSSSTFCFMFIYYHAFSFAKSPLIATKMLKKNGDNGFEAVVSSTLCRAIQTAELCMVPLKKASDCSLIALPKMAEIQCDDIWNEPRSQSQTQKDWPTWSCQEESVENQLDTAQSLIQRSEYVWKILTEMQGSVIGVSAHGCFLFFFSRRLAAAQNRRLPPFKEDKWKNGEVRRVVLPEFDGEMSWAEFGGFLEFADFDFYNRYHRRATYVNSLRLAGFALPHWTHQEWRWARSDSEIDAEVADAEGQNSLGLQTLRGWSLNNLFRCVLCFPRCCFSRANAKLQ